MKFFSKVILPLVFIIVWSIYDIFFFESIIGLEPENNNLSIILLVASSLLLIGILIYQIRKLTSKKKYPYLLRDDFLSPAEQSFYLTLRHTVSDWALVWPKIRLGDLFYVSRMDKKMFWTYTNKITSKHVDFLLSDPKTAKPLIGIELDDKSHKRKDRQERDEFVDNVFSAANLPLARIPVKHSYSTSELDLILRQHIDLNKVEMPIHLVNNEDQSLTPKCPKCGNEMVLRTAKSGANKGKQFWGCPNYPRCRGIIKIE